MGVETPQPFLNIATSSEHRLGVSSVELRNRHSGGMANILMRMKYTAILDYARDRVFASTHTLLIMCYMFEMRMTDGQLGEHTPILLSTLIWHPLSNVVNRSA